MDKKARILIVEDESDVAEANAQYLSGINYEVHCAGTLNDARAIIWEYPPDLILLDILMPDGSGYEFCRELRGVTAAPVIFLTCLGEDSNVVDGLTMGGDDYIIKPYNMEVLRARVEAQLRRRGLGYGRIELPPLFIDTASGSVELSGRDVPLTQTEFRLLLYLVENRGKELGQAQIYRDIWGAEPGTMGSTVRVYISRLRQKLRLDDSSCFELSATANQGYIFLRVRYPG